MTINRRRFLTAGTLAASGGIVGFPNILRAQEPIRIGALMDLSGPLQAYGAGKLRCMELAVDEINEAGGLLGRPLEVVAYDTQTQNQLYGQYAQQLALRDRVAVVHGAVTSAAREVARPVLRRANTLYFYNMIYEGGLCDRNTFVTGPTPEQLLVRLIPYMIERFGPRFYVLAADYNFGHYSTEWATQIAAAHGGEVIGSEFLPLDANTFGSTINRIQQAAPDFVFNIFVGPAHASFYGQWAAAGMNQDIPMASHTLGDSGDHKRLSPEVSEGLVTVKNYFDELDTDASVDFLDRFAAKFGENHDYLGSLAIAEYQGMLLWAEAVRQAESIERDAVIDALETGISIEGPSGTVAIHPPSHHCYLNMYLAEVRGGDFDILDSWDAVAPVSEGDTRCNLIEDPDLNTQFEPEI